MATKKTVLFTLKNGDTVEVVQEKGDTIILRAETHWRDSCPVLKITPIGYSAIEVSVEKRQRAHPADVG